MEMGSNSKPELSSRRLPSFFKVMFDDFYDYLPIPAAFVNLFDGELPREFVLRTGDGRERRVTVTDVENKVFLKNGWNDFVRENSLELGDFVVFQHVGESNFNVRIFEKSGCSREVRRVNTTAKRSNVIDADFNCTIDELGTGTSNPRDRSESNEFQPESIHEETTSAEVECVTPLFSRAKVPKTEATQGNPRAVETANKFTSKLPFFKVIINRSSTTSYLHLPQNFVLRYLKDVQCIMLRISNRSWPVKLLAYKHICRISAGWPAFTKDNTLQEGDACVFELMKGRKIVFNVSIFRCTR